MAKIQKIMKSRKEQRCSKCREIIPAGSSYYKAEPYAGPVIVRCMRCGLRAYETSGSAYIQRVGELVEQWEETYGSPTSDTTADIIAEIESIQEECESNLENIPEQLQEGSAGTLLQERIDELDSCHSDLENIDWDQIEADLEDEAKEDYAEENDIELTDDGELPEGHQEEFDNYLFDRVSQEVAEQISEALGTLTY